MKKIKYILLAVFFGYNTLFICTKKEYSLKKE